MGTALVVVKTGRPPIFTPAIADEICKRLSMGETLRSICRDEGMPGRNTVYTWLWSIPGFRDQYAQARAMQAEHWADEIVEIADDANPIDVQLAKLRVDTRKWLMARMAPRKWGDRVEVDGVQGGDVNVTNITVNFVDAGDEI